MGVDRPVWGTDEGEQDCNLSGQRGVMVEV